MDNRDQDVYPWRENREIPPPINKPHGMTKSRGCIIQVGVSMVQARYEHSDHVNNGWKPDKSLYPSDTCFKPSEIKRWMYFPDAGSV